jgi:hypothetical protein
MKECGMDEQPSRPAAKRRCVAAGTPMGIEKEIRLVAVHLGWDRKNV